ncbi:MAG: hypothetical protein JSU68_12580 [Phycisphaerales bacterium]|nr:MAG: hypothetical protein JSU68_12580 [Phycisphaerales bacterium]
MPSADAKGSLAIRLKHWVIIGLALAGLILLGHGWGLRTGLFLDDHSHYAKLKNLDWSFQSAVESAHLGIVGDVLDFWNRRETGLRFFRPIAFWTMKIEYVVGAWDPLFMHAVSLIWHWLAAMLVTALGYQFAGKPEWAAVAGGAFAVHPGQVACTYWIASQTELQVTVWLLLAGLCYARYSAWPAPMLAPAKDWYREGRLPAARRWWLMPALLCFAMALGCRENAIMFAPLVILGDVLFRGVARRGLASGPRQLRWGAYLMLGGVVVAYLLARWQALGGFPLPGKPYMITPADAGFWSFVLNKFVFNMLAMFAFIPVIPVGGLTFFQGRPAQFYLPFMGVILGWAAILWIFRRRPGLLFAFGWLILMTLPLLPVFVSPHHLYLPSVGFALILMSVLAWGAGAFKPRGLPTTDARQLVALVVVVLHGVGLTFGSWAMGWVYGASTGIEDLVLQDIRDTSPKPIRDDHHLFFINVPLIAYYAVPAIEQEASLHGLNGHVLTFSPSPLLMDQPGRVERLDDRTLRISVEGEPYLAGVTGKALIQATGFDRVPVEGDLYEADLYTVSIEETDDGGVRSLVFRFARPLDSPDFHFFLTSRQRLAYALDFETIDPARGGTARRGGLIMSAPFEPEKSWPRAEFDTRLADSFDGPRGISIIERG